MKLRSRDLQATVNGTSIKKSRIQKEQTNKTKSTMYQLPHNNMNTSETVTYRTSIIDPSNPIRLVIHKNTTSNHSSPSQVLDDKPQTISCNLSTNKNRPEQRYHENISPAPPPSPPDDAMSFYEKFCIPLNLTVRREMPVLSPQLPNTSTRNNENVTVNDYFQRTNATNVDGWQLTDNLGCRNQRNVGTCRTDEDLRARVEKSTQTLTYDGETAMLNSRKSVRRTSAELLTKMSECFVSGNNKRRMVDLNEESGRNLQMHQIKKTMNHKTTAEASTQLNHNPNKSTTTTDIHPCYSACDIYGNTYVNNNYPTNAYYYHNYNPTPLDLTVPHQQSETENNNPPETVPKSVAEANKTDDEDVASKIKRKVAQLSELILTEDTNQELQVTSTAVKMMRQLLKKKIRKRSKETKKNQKNKNKSIVVDNVSNTTSTPIIYPSLSSSSSSTLSPIKNATPPSSNNTIPKSNPISEVIVLVDSDDENGEDDHEKNDKSATPLETFIVSNEEELIEVLFCLLAYYYNNNNDVNLMVEIRKNLEESRTETNVSQSRSNNVVVLENDQENHVSSSVSADSHMPFKKRRMSTGGVGNNGREQVEEEVGFSGRRSQRLRSVPENVFYSSSTSKTGTREIDQGTNKKDLNNNKGNHNRRY